MDVTGLKILSGFLFFVLAFLFGWIPFYCLRRHLGPKKATPVQRGDSRRPVVVQCLHSLASGVMLATCLLHLLPESSKSVRAAMFPECTQETEGREVTNVTSLDLAIQNDGQGQWVDRQFPVAESLVALGFLVVYMVDGIVRSCSRSENRAKSSYLKQGLDDLSTTSDSEASSLSSFRPFPETGGQWSSGPQPQTIRSLQLRWSRPKFSVAAHEAVQHDTSECLVEPEAAADRELGEENDHLQGQANTRSDYSTSGSAGSSTEEHPLASSGRHPGQSADLRSVTLVSALCVHGFFDGVMLGLQTSKAVVTSLLLALSIHKSFVAVGMSLTLLGSSDKKASDRVTLLYVFLFSSVAPLGLLVSAALVHRTFEMSGSSEVSLVPGCLQSFAVGTFLYVTLSDLTERGRHGGGVAALVVRYLFLLVGFGLMAALRAYLGAT